MKRIILTGGGTAGHVTPNIALMPSLKEAGYEVISGPRITGDGYYESCVVGIEGNQIEITI